MPTNKTNNFYNIQANTKTKHADIYLYGFVGGWRVNIQRFLDEINEYKNYKTLDVYVSTFGGTFFDGLPIYNTLKQHKAYVTTINNGYAVSMGSHIMLAGDRIKMAQNALFMIHSPLTLIWEYSNAARLRKEAKVLDMHEKALLPRYIERLSLSENKVKTLLRNETWYDAESALAAGLIDEIVDKVDLDSIEDKMEGDGDGVENQWAAVVNTFHTPPPERFISRFCNRAPETKPYFEKIKQRYAEKQDDEEMTDDQFDKLQKAMSDSITNAMANLSGTIEDSFKALPAALAPSLDAQNTATTAMSAQLKTGLETVTNSFVDALKDQAVEANKQSEKQADAIAGIDETLKEFQKNPVNQLHVPEQTNGTASNTNEKRPLYS